MISNYNFKNIFKSNFLSKSDFAATGAAAVRKVCPESADGKISQPLVSEPTEFARAEAAAAPTAATQAWVFGNLREFMEICEILPPPPSGISGSAQKFSSFNLKIFLDE